MAGCLTTAYIGMGGSVTSLTSPPAEIIEWNIDETVDLISADYLGNSDHQWIPGLRGWTGSMTAQGKIAFSTGSSAQVVFATGTGGGDAKRTGDIIISTTPIKCIVNDKVGYSCNFTGCGSLTHGTV